jgi:hypothetical protein
MAWERRNCGMGGRIIVGGSYKKYSLKMLSGLMAWERRNCGMGGRIIIVGGS